jgi:hypothetical protein
MGFHELDIAVHWSFCPVQTLSQIYHSTQRLRSVRRHTRSRQTRFIRLKIDIEHFLHCSELLGVLDGPIAVVNIELCTLRTTQGILNGGFCTNKFMANP